MRETVNMDDTEIVPRRADAVELVPTRRGWVPAPAAPGRRAARTARAWLRETYTPADPRTYLGAGERALLRTHQHWIVPLRGIAQATAMMPLAILLGFVAPSVWWIQLGLGLVAVAHQGYVFYRFLAWRTDQVIVTDQRVIRTSGVFTTTVDAVHLDQITDSTYHRSLIGHVFNYGTVRIGSAGQNQSLERIEFVPAPGEIYRATLPRTMTRLGTRPLRAP
jgi:hypothetical protein